MPADLLANAERPASDRPAPAQEREDPYRGFWLGPAPQPADALRWRARALAAERDVEALRRALAAWRYRP